MAYTLGLWSAIGCIYQGKLFDMTMPTKDKYILMRVAKNLEYEGPLQDFADKQVARLNFSCAVIYDDIVALGGTPKRTSFLNVPKEFTPDYVRGFFDGNGEVFRIKGDRYICSFVCQNQNFLAKLYKVLKTEAMVEGGAYDEVRHELKFGHRDSMKIGDYMYKSSPEMFLLRKRNKFY
jgi:hypothetical protein